MNRITSYNEAMKRITCFLTILFLMSYASIPVRASVTSGKTTSGDSIRIVSATELLTLTEKWATEYNRINPDVKIKVIQADGKIPSSIFLREGAIGFFPDSYLKTKENESAWKIVVGRDVIVPVMNSGNPYMAEINLHGISVESLKLLFDDSSSSNWGSLLGGDKKEKVSYYVVNDPSVAVNLSTFLQKDVVLGGGSSVSNNDELISAITKDPYAIGFCRLANIIDPEKPALTENISLVPVDKNNNGTLDYNEKIYEDFNSFSRGIWIGKYPRSLVTNIYSVAGTQPTDVKETAFLKWVLCDGQKYLVGNGYSDLLVAERQVAADRLYIAKVSPLQAGSGFSLLKAAIIILGLIIALGFVADAVFRYNRRKGLVMNVVSSATQSFPGENGIKVPAGLYFDKTHTWAFMEKSGIVTVGIDDFLQHVTGPISKIKMKGEGKSVKKGEPILSIIQNGKQLNLYAPVSGTITEQNHLLEENSALINQSPYGEGWIYKIEPNNWVNENQLLFMADRQRQFLTKEFSRLKDFLAAALNGPEGNLVPVMLQDGGEIKDGILSDMGPEIWEDFQTNFIDPSRQVWFYEIF
jgi:glycine cleavage system H lipoate-binding protein/ABC-type phosphate transport system substrate-binding protein